jgi:hypothetical protein
MAATPSLAAGRVLVGVQDESVDQVVPKEAQLAEDRAPLGQLRLTRNTLVRHSVKTA